MHFDENSFFAGDKKEAHKLKVIILYLTVRYKLINTYADMNINPYIVLIEVESRP